MNTSSKDAIRRDKEALVKELTQTGAKFKGNACTCPFHDDHRPSGGIYEKDGVWRFKCQSCAVGGDIFDIRAKLTGTTPGQVMRETGGVPEKKPARVQFTVLSDACNWLTKNVGDIVSVHRYEDVNGLVQVVYRLQRNGEKSYRPVRVVPGGFQLGAAPKPLPLYGLPKIADTKTVIVAEGEKCCDVLNRYGFTAVTSAGGAKNAKGTDWAPLAGKAVILCPDNDTEGRLYIAEVEQILDSLNPATRISVIDPAGLDLKEKEDVADFVEQLTTLGKSDAEITTAIDGALKTSRARSIAATVAQRYADIAAGRFVSIEWSWASLNRLTQAAQPGAVIIIAGPPGASKSFMVLQAFAYWFEQRVRVSLYELEEDRTYHLMRVLAQKTGNGSLTDVGWVKENPQTVQALCSENSDFLNGFRQVLFTSPDIQPTLQQLAAWTADRAKTGSRIIGLDPITAAARTAEPWVDDARFLQAVKGTAVETGCSIILVSHPIKAVNYPDLSQLAGSAAYQRFAQTILWLENHDGKESRIATPCGATQQEHNRTLHILKARNGRGMGMKLAFEFDSDSLSLRELGLILKKVKE